ncbi:MAG: uroporphyrinogen decarboxylase family protein, partial [Gammaproteobacteria bacterium]
TIKGQYDEIFKQPAPQDAVHVAGPVDLMTLTIMHRLYGLTSAEFYKEGPERFVRTSLMTQKLLGMPKLYISWPVYGFTAEALGQTMIYSDQYSPGTDPDKPLANADNWQDIATPDMNAGIPKLLDGVLTCYQRLTGLSPVLHLTAPYSLAADIYGQEHIISALTHDPEFVNRFLDHLADTVLQPWMDHFFSQYPDGWVELSDASGSPFFIGPKNCKDVAIRSTQRLIAANPWGNRVYDANYRGDYVTQASKGSTSTSRRRSSRKTSPEQPSLVELFELKNSICPDYVIRLAEDRVPVSFYVEQAIKYNIPLFIGIGATQVDRNSIADLDISKQEIRTTTSEYVEAIKMVASTIAKNGYEARELPWPGTVYLEDVSAESNFELIEIIVDTVLEQGAL